MTPAIATDPLLPRPEILDSAVVVDAIPAMFPGVTRSGSNLIASFSTVPDGWPGGQVGITRSADEGQTWSPPEIVAAPTESLDAVLNALGITTLRDGTVLLPYNGVRWTDGSGVDGRVITLHVVRSADGGRSWTGDAVDVGFNGPCVYGKLVELADDRILWPIWGQASAGERWRSVVYESSDGGVSWQLGATIGYDPDARLPGSYATPEVSGLDGSGRPDPSLTRDPTFRPHAATDGYTETTVCPLADGTLLAVLRQQGVNGDAALTLFRSVSTDHGRSWSTPSPLPFSGMSPSLHRTPEGLLLATRRHTPDGSSIRPGVEIRSGSANGSRWGSPIDLVDPNCFTLTAEYQCGYPAMVTLQNGSILVLFYSFRPTGERYVVSNCIAVPES